jgi:hypothetical protein
LFPSNFNFACSEWNDNCYPTLCLLRSLTLHIIKNKT